MPLDLPHVPRPRSRFDGFANVLSGLGAPGLDRTSSPSIFGRGRLSGISSFLSNRFRINDFTSIYVGNGLAAKIIDKPSDDCLARGVTIENDDEGAMLDEYDRLSVISRMQDGVRWSRLFGAAAILLIAKDGGTLDQPLNIDGIDQIVEIRILAGNLNATDELYLVTDDLTRLLKPEFYEYQPSGDKKIRIHETRLIPISGEPLPPNYTSYNGSQLPWQGRSVLDGTSTNIERYTQGLQWTLRLLERKQQGIYKMEGLGELFSNGEDDIVSRRINLVDLVRSNLNSVVVDATDDYSVQNLGLDGIESVLRQFQIAISADAEIPVTVLFGTSSTGLNSSGSGDLESYYGLLARVQSRIVKSPLEKLTAILYAQKSFSGKVPEDWNLEFNPLWIPSDVEKAQADYNEAQAKSNRINAMITLLDANILLPEEVREIVIAEEYTEHNFDGVPPEALQSIWDTAQETKVNPPDPVVLPPKAPAPGGIVP